MASGHVNRANRPNTWPQPTNCTVKKTLANGAPSTHGTSAASLTASLFVRIRVDCGLGAVSKASCEMDKVLEPVSDRIRITPH
jgi:hypothetical protein